MSQESDRLWKERGERAQNVFARHPFATVIGGIVALVVVIGVLSWALSWGGQPARITGVQNVRNSWAFFYQYDEKLTAQARIVCQTVRAQKRGDQLADGTLLAYEQTYEKIAADYNAEARNKLEKGLVRPPGVPASAPSLQAKVQQRIDAGDAAFEGCDPGTL